MLQTESETSCEEAARLTAEGAEDDDEGYDYGALPPPPDGGYGWVVVFASFMCNLIVDGIAYTFGIFLPELVIYFGEGKGTVAWIGSLLSGVYLAAGKLCSSDVLPTYGSLFGIKNCLRYVSVSTVEIVIYFCLMRCVSVKLSLAYSGAAICCAIFF